MIERQLLEDALDVLKTEPLLVEIEDADRVVFVGDTHGDLIASQLVLDRYLEPGSVLVFIGDYVDRGPQSKANVDTLLRYKLEHPDQLILLQGNHENWTHAPFIPATFWERLTDDEVEIYSRVLTELPYTAITPNGIIAVHGALPALDALQEINDVKADDDAWWHLIWGDYQPRPGQFLGDLGSRPQFGEDRFKTLMERFGQNVLIRGHQPPAPKLLYDDRCITIICSSSHTERPREIVIADMGVTARSADDVEIMEI